MSMNTYANSGWVIPREVLEKEFPKELEFLSENEDAYIEWLQCSADDEIEESARFSEINEKIKEWGKSKGLELSFDCTYMDEYNDEMQEWLCFCDNAITLNPAFKEIGGEQFLWTTYG